MPPHKPLTKLAFPLARNSRSNSAFLEVASSKPVAFSKMEITTPTIMATKVPLSRISTDQSTWVKVENRQSCQRASFGKGLKNHPSGLIFTQKVLVSHQSS